MVDQVVVMEVMVVDEVVDQVVMLVVDQVVDEVVVVVDYLVDQVAVVVVVFMVIVVDRGQHCICITQLEIEWSGNIG